MKKFQIISKKNCSRCDRLKVWLKENNLDYEEWKLEDPQIKDKLLADPTFVHTFCDVNGCMIYTPVMKVEETGNYYYKRLFGMSGIRGDFIKKTLEVEDSK